jgi:hypothetical protein
VHFFSVRLLAAMGNMELAALYNGNGRALQTVKDILIREFAAILRMYDFTNGRSGRCA